MKKVLIIGAHPDDELLGCAGTVSKLIKNNWEGRSLILGKGLLARGKEQKNSLNEHLNNAKKANALIGIHNVAFYDFPDNAFDKVSLLEIIKVIEKEISTFKPNIIFTHFGQDLNIDHRLTFQAVLTACRPQPGYFNPDIYSFFIPSSTDWIDGYSLKAFIPNVFVDISKEIDLKLEALKIYKSEMKNFPHSRSIESLKIFSQYWGTRVGKEYIEPFVLVRKFEIG